MRKIPTIFLRDPANPGAVTEEPNPACAWVFAGEGVATRKYDGTCVMLDDDRRWWARREVKSGKTPPADYVPVSTDTATGKTVGWEPVEQSAFAKFHAEALDSAPVRLPGTYELVGPKINRNPEQTDCHVLIKHEFANQRPGFPRTYAGIRSAVLALAENLGCEGIVWHHPDGRMAKIKARDFAAQGG